MYFYFKNLKAFCSKIRKAHKSIERFVITYNNINFDVLLDIDSTPFQMMVGAQGHNLAFILNIEPGFRTEIPDNIYHELCKVLDLNYNKDHFSSFLFLKYIDNNIPEKCTPDIVNPDYLLRFRPYHSSDTLEAEKTRFVGWNNHKTDGRTARNFDKTERYLGKSVADFCRSHNVSSMWTKPDDQIPRDISFPAGYINSFNTQ